MELQDHHVSESVTPSVTGQPVASQPQQSPTVKYVGFGRLAAFFIDALIAGAISIAVVSIFFGIYAFIGISATLSYKKFSLPFGDDPYGWATILIIIVFMLYYISFTSHFGATPGKMLFKMAIIDRHSARLSFGRIILRECIGKYISVPFFFISLLLFIFDKKKRSVHDWIAGTFVIYKQ